MKKFTPLVEFRVKHARKARHYFQVKVFSTVKEMREYGATGGYYPRPKLGEFLGLCTAWGDGSPGPKNEIGEILLCKKYLMADVVTHECGHAAFTIMEYLRPIEYNYQDGTSTSWRWLKIEHEEEYCYALGSLISTVYENLIKTGLLEN